MSQSIMRPLPAQIYDGDSYGGRFIEPAPAERELWRPSRDEQMAAVEILLACSLPRELRSALREREIELRTREDL